MKMRPLASLLCISSVLSLAACVTVNVNFPESAVQKATDDYVRELYRAKEKGRAGVEDPEAVASPSPQPGTSKKKAMLDLLIPSAHADEEIFTVNTDKALSIRDNLKGRVSEVLAQKRQGNLGENNDGLLEVPEAAKSKKLLVKKLEKIVADENKDRMELYNEVVSANKLGANGLKRVQKSFARSFQAESPSGTFVQDVEGKWARKP